MSWMRRQLDRPIAGHKRTTATVRGLLLALAAAGLILTSPTHSSTGRRGEPARSTTRSVTASGGATWRWTPADAAEATARAQAFLDGYLLYLYGQAPAGQVKDATAGFARALERERRVVPPGIRALHPRVVAVHISPQAPGRAIATALVSDAEVVHYPIRLVLTETAGHWRVDGQESTR
jgi:hypothetical protein